jgi:TRAP-type mannitol/chloroaromatic compound transport system substrate-binding protein
VKRQVIIGLLVGVVLLGILFAGCAAPTPEGPEVYNWKVQCTYSWSDPEVMAFKEFCDEVRDKSGGRINIARYAEGEIIPVEEVWDAVGKGVVEMGHGTPGYYAGEYPVLASATGFPFTWMADVNELWTRLHDSGYMDLMEEVANKGNLHFFEFTPHGEYPSLYGSVPIDSIDDFKGLKMRFNPPFDEIYRKVGAEVVWLPGSEMYMALKLGTLDIASWDCTAFKSMKWHEVVDYYYRPCLVENSASAYWMNLDLWNSLSDDLKEIMTTAAEHQFFYVRSVYEDEMAWVDEHTNLGYEIWYLPDEVMGALRQVGVDLIDEFGQQDEYCARAAEILKRDFVSYYEGA